MNWDKYKDYLNINSMHVSVLQVTDCHVSTLDQCFPVTGEGPPCALQEPNSIVLVSTQTQYCFLSLRNGIVHRQISLKESFKSVLLKDRCL